MMGGFVNAADSAHGPVSKFTYKILTRCPAVADPAKLAKLLGEKSARLVKKKKKKGGSSMRASDQLTADDYITPYIDDEDTDVEE